MKKTIYSAMKNYVETTLSDVPNDLISISSETSVDKETGETSSFIRIEAEVQDGEYYITNDDGLPVNKINYIEYKK